MSNAAAPPKPPITTDGHPDAKRPIAQSPEERIARQREECADTENERVIGRGLVRRELPDLECDGGHGTGVSSATHVPVYARA